MRYFTLYCLILSSLSFGDTDPYLAPSGHVLKQESWVFSPNKALEVRNKLVDLDSQLKINDSLNKQIDLYKGLNDIQKINLNLVMEQNDKLAKSLNDERSMTNWERIGWFGIGVLATVLTVYGVNQATK